MAKREAILVKIRADETGNAAREAKMFDKLLVVLYPMEPELKEELENAYNKNKLKKVLASLEDVHKFIKETKEIFVRNQIPVKD